MFTNLLIIRRYILLIKALVFLYKTNPINCQMEVYLIFNILAPFYIQNSILYGNVSIVLDLYTEILSLAPVI